MSCLEGKESEGGRKVKGEERKNREGGDIGLRKERTVKLRIVKQSSLLPNKSRMRN